VRRQLVYVAVSRARRRVWLVGRADLAIEQQQRWSQWLSDDLKIA